MITKRIIPCLDVKDGRVVKGVQFVSLRDAGDPVELARVYDEQGADELVFLDISASHEGRKTMVHVVQRVAAQLAIPFTVGGGISTLEDMKTILRAGADKVSVNTAALLRPELITEGANFLVRNVSSWRLMLNMMKRCNRGACIRMAVAVQRIGKLLHGRKRLSNVEQEKFY